MNDEAFSLFFEVLCPFLGAEFYSKLRVSALGLAFEGELFRHQVKWGSLANPGGLEPGGSSAALGWCFEDAPACAGEVGQSVSGLDDFFEDEEVSREEPRDA